MPFSLIHKLTYILLYTQPNDDILKITADIKRKKTSDKINRYGKLAVAYAKELIAHQERPSSQGWEDFVFKNGFSQSSAKKGCPKSAFLALCQEGFVSGIPAGYYTSSKKNGKYTVKAVRILQNNPDLRNNPGELWNAIPDHPRTYNQQMDVVCALWNEGLIHIPE